MCPIPVLKVGSLGMRPVLVVPGGVVCMATFSLRSQTTRVPSSFPEKTRGALRWLKQPHTLGDSHTSRLERREREEDFNGVHNVSTVLTIVVEMVLLCSIHILHHPHVVWNQDTSIHVECEMKLQPIHTRTLLMGVCVVMTR